MRLIIRNIFNYISIKDLRKIYVVGSFSTGDVTVIPNKHSNYIFMSDVDLIVDVSPVKYLKCFVVNFDRKLSEMLSSMLQLKGINTHVSITITSFTLFDLFKGLNVVNSVYIYELTPVEIYQDDYSITSFSTNKRCKPNRLDSLNLVFSSFTDYIFTKLELFENETIYVKNYIIAKRCLTLLYSLMLFNSIYPKNYSMRVSLAKQNYTKLCEVLSYKDLKILEVLADYKIRGDWKILSQKLPTKPGTPHLTYEYLDEYFKELGVKVFSYELRKYICVSGKYGLLTSNSSLTHLLEDYKSKAVMSIPVRLVNTALCLVLFIKEKNFKKLKYHLYSILIKGLRVDDLLRYVVGLLFLSIINGKPKSEFKSAIEVKRLWLMFMM